MGESSTMVVLSSFEIVGKVGRDRTQVIKLLNLDAVDVAQCG